MSRLRAVHAPLHGTTAKPKHLRRALRLGRGGVVGFSEAYRVKRWLAHRPLWRLFTGATNRVDERGRHVGWDVAIMVRRWRRVLDHGSFKAADEVPASLKIAPERWVVWVILGPRHAPLLVVGAHPHAVPTPGSARAKGYAWEWTLIEALIEQKREEHPGLCVLLLGDLNHRDDNKPLTPAEPLRRLGMTWHSHGLDWLAWAGIKPVSDIRTISTEVNGQDHPWLLGDFSWH